MTTAGCLSCHGPQSELDLSKHLAKSGLAFHIMRGVVMLNKARNFAHPRSALILSQWKEISSFYTYASDMANYTFSCQIS